MGRWEFELAPRQALAAPTNAWDDTIQSTAIIIVSILSALGAGWMMLSFACFRSLRSFRHQLIMGLAISDFVMAVNFASSTGMNLSGRFIGAPEQRVFCSFNGFMTQVFVIQTDYWALTIAICTYAILADHKRTSTWIQDNTLILSIVPWVLSILWASIGMGVIGYGNIGAWCWFTSDEVRLLVNFIPRWIIIILMLALYARLYLVLFRAHRFMSSADAESGSNPITGTGSGARTLTQGGSTAWTGSGDPNDRAHRHAARHTSKLKKLARRMMLYPIAYMVIWTLPTSIRIYQASTGRPAPFALQTVDKACIVSQGFIDAIVYGASESSLSAWRNLLWPSRFPTLDGVNVATGPAHNAGGDRHEKQSKPSRVPASRLSDSDTIGPEPNIETTYGTSSTHINAFGGSRSRSASSSRSDDDVELRRMDPPPAAVGPFAIRKTVVIDVSDAERTSAALSKNNSWFDSKC